MFNVTSLYWLGVPVFDWLKLLASPFCVVVAAMVAGWIAWQNTSRTVSVQRMQAQIQAKQAKIQESQAEIARTQAETAGHKMRLDLFEKRYNLYRRAKAFLWAAFCEDKAMMDKTVTPFLKVAGQAEMLFGPEVSKPIAEIYERLMRKQSNENRFNRLNAKAEGREYTEPEKHKYEQLMDDEEAWFEWVEKLYQELDKLVLPYLNFQTVR